jgi:hypothetical protein
VVRRGRGKTSVASLQRFDELIRSLWDWLTSDWIFLKVIHTSDGYTEDHSAIVEASE